VYGVNVREGEGNTIYLAAEHDFSPDLQVRRCLVQQKRKVFRFSSPVTEQGLIPGSINAKVGWTALRLCMSILFIFARHQSG
jgi:hypothetical protein